jgi:predicted PurR-regulated permease PerM
MSTSSNRSPAAKPANKGANPEHADGHLEARTTPPVVRTEPVLGSPLSVSALVLAVLAVVYALYVGKEVVLPVMLALVLKLLLQPVMDFFLKRLRLPAPFAALILIICLFCGIAAIVFTISGPASGWIGKAPEILPLLKQKLVLLREPIDYLQSALKELEEVATPTGANGGVPTVAVKDTSAVASAVAWSTVAIVTRLFTTMIVLFFLLAAGDRLLRGLVEVLPRFSDKKQAADIATEIQRQIGGYLLTITVMNGAVGILTGLAMWGCGLGDPILWGAAAFLLNYVPILGPLTGIAMFLLAGIVALEWPWGALLPAGIYLLIHILEGEIITPLLLASRFYLNPVLVIVSLFFWHAVWGIPGALLAVPLLAMFKISADRIETLKPAGHIVGA